MEIIETPPATSQDSHYLEAGFEFEGLVYGHTSLNVPNLIWTWGTPSQTIQYNIPCLGSIDLTCEVTRPRPHWSFLTSKRDFCFLHQNYHIFANSVSLIFSTVLALIFNTMNIFVCLFICWDLSNWHSSQNLGHLLSQPFFHYSAALGTFLGWNTTELITSPE